MRYVYAINCVMETSTFVIALAQRIWPISKPL
jgi:hypothetical protein